MQRLRMDLNWRKARIAGRILLRSRKGKLTVRDRRLAQQLAGDSGVTERLLEQALVSLKKNVSA